MHGKVTKLEKSISTGRKRALALRAGNSCLDATCGQRAWKGRDTDVVI